MQCYEINHDTNSQAYELMVGNWVGVLYEDYNL